MYRTAPSTCILPLCLQDEVGFAVSGAGTWAFPFRVPEGEWTHLAFVSSPASATPTDTPEPPGLNATLGATNGANLGATNGGGETKGRGAPPTNPAGGPKPPVGAGGANAARIEGPWGRRKSVSNKVIRFQISIKGRVLSESASPFLCPLGSDLGLRDSESNDAPRFASPSLDTLRWCSCTPTGS